jgi:hypothetical protein
MITKNREGVGMAKKTNPVVHDAPDHVAWKGKWSKERKPQAMAHGADKADEDGNIKVQHEVKEENFEKFKKHVDAMEASGKRKEMGAKNPPY